MKFLEKVRGWPESRRKIILWTLIIIIVLVLISLAVKSFQKRLKSFQERELFRELPELPKLEIPKIFEELKKLEEMIKEIH